MPIVSIRIPRVCKIGYTCRCLHSKLFGSPSLEGAQAQYVRVPKAGGTLFSLSNPALANKYPNLSSISDASLLFLGDILPTGLFAALQALNHPKVTSAILQAPWPTHMEANFSSLSAPQSENILTFAIIGLGPVGVCAGVALIEQLSKKKNTKFQIVGIDLVESRRSKMEFIYAKICETESYNGVFVAQGIDEAKETIRKWTSGIGCNAVLEVITEYPITLSRTLTDSQL